MAGWDGKHGMLGSGVGDAAKSNERLFLLVLVHDPDSLGNLPTLDQLVFSRHGHRRKKLEGSCCSMCTQHLQSYANDAIGRRVFTSRQRALLEMLNTAMRARLRENEYTGVLERMRMKIMTRTARN